MHIISKQDPAENAGIRFKTQNHKRIPHAWLVCVLFCGLVTVYRMWFGQSCVITFSLKSLIIFCTAGTFQPYAPFSSPHLLNFSVLSLSSWLFALFSISPSSGLSVCHDAADHSEWVRNIWVTEPHEKQTQSATVQHPPTRTNTHRAWSVAVWL